MLDYQRQDSTQTLAQGMAEYFAANEKHLKTRKLTPEAEEFFRCHDAAHVVFGCDISLSDEMIVKISSIFGTTVGLSVLKGYRLAESKEVYESLQVIDILRTAIKSLFLIPRTIWRCTHMRDRWRWDDFDGFLDVPLKQIRENFGVQTNR